MIKFIESPLYDNWFKNIKIEKSLLICSPYIKEEAMKKVISLLDKNSDIEIKVLFRGNINEFIRKSTDIEILNFFLEEKRFNISEIRRITNLHMKAYLIDGKHLLITSGNLTNSGMFVNDGTENFEGGLYTTDGKVIDEFLKYFEDIWTQSQKMEEFFDEITQEYQKYYEYEYKEKDSIEKIVKKKYKFHALSGKENNHDVEPDRSVNDYHFTLDEIPSNGSFEYLPLLLDIVYSNPDGIKSIQLGEIIRRETNRDKLDSAIDNSQIGIEKSKFAEFFGLVTIEKHGGNIGNIVKPNRIGRMYLSMNEDGKNNYIKDVFFNKKIITSIFREKLLHEDFDLLDFLQKNCYTNKGKLATKDTLSRKVGPMKEIFAKIESMCSEEELKELLKI